MSIAKVSAEILAEVWMGPMPTSFRMGVHLKMGLCVGADLKVVKGRTCIEGTASSMRRGAEGSAPERSGGACTARAEDNARKR